MYLRPTWAEIDLQSLQFNIQQIRALISPNTKLCAVVKADAYGHGILPVANSAVQNGADYLAVAILNEGITIRQSGLFEPVLVLGFIPFHQTDLVVAHDLIATVYSSAFAKNLSDSATALGTKAKIHVKVDTGMSRIGIQPQETLAFIKYLHTLPNLEVEGIYSHFATADSSDKTHALSQYKTFINVINELYDNNIHIPIKHIANTAAIIDLPQTHLDMVRLGIGMYGYEPSNEMNNHVPFKPVMSLKCHIAHIKEVAANTAVSYGSTYKIPHNGRIATLPIGYADGYSRGLSNIADVLVDGKRAPVCGRICMDQCMINISNLPHASEESEITLFGDSEITADEIANKLHTISYEIISMISKRVPRVYKRHQN